MTFEEHGHIQFPIDIPGWVTDEIDDTIDMCWSNGSNRLAYANNSGLKLMTPDGDSSPGYRVADLHGVSSGARWLYLNGDIHRRVRGLLGPDAIAFQSLYFRWGSQQALHRDHAYVGTEPVDNQVGVWIALEDICDESGPLQYVGGSHKWDYYKFPDGSPRNDNRKWGDSYMRERSRFNQKQVDDCGEVSRLICKKGTVFIWHARLLHGGSRIDAIDPPTRKSLIVHFSTKSGVKTRKSCVGGRVYATKRMLQRDGQFGFDSPLVKE